MGTKTSYETRITKTTFKAESRLSSVDLNNRPVEDQNSIGDLEEAFLACIRLENVKNLRENNIENLNKAFYNCTSLKHIPTIPTSVKYMESTFQNCINLNCAITIPENVENIDNCFNGCKKLAEVPVINTHHITSIINTFQNTSLETTPTLPNEIENMERGFYNCKSLKTITNFPTNIKNLNETFYNCVDLTTIPEIPAGVTSMVETFANCKKLKGDIKISATGIENADDCFYLPNINVPDRNVFVKIGSSTFLSLTRAGYNRQVRQHGVLLLPYGQHIVTFTIYTDPAGETPLEDPDGVSVEVRYIDPDTHNLTIKTAFNILSTYPEGYDTSKLPRNVFFVTIPDNLSSNFEYTVTPQGPLYNVLSVKTGSSVSSETNVDVKLEHETKTFTLQVLLVTNESEENNVQEQDNTTTAQIYLGDQLIASGTGTGLQTVTVNYIQETGLNLTLTCKAKSTKTIIEDGVERIENVYIPDEEIVVWNTDDNYTQTISLYPCINEDTGVLEEPPAITPQILEKLSYQSNKANEKKTFTLYKNYVYKITCVGGGGGSSYGFGGAGGAWIGTVFVTDKDLTINTRVGAGGLGGEHRPRNHDGHGGTSSTIKDSSGKILSITAGGGHPGQAARKDHQHYISGYRISPAPNVTNSLIYQQSFANTKKERRASWISNQIYGAGGNGGYYKHGTGENGKSGYISIQYIGSLSSNKDGTIILEAVKATSGTINLEAGLYRLTLIGGGGGVLRFYDDTKSYYLASGGSGSGFRATLDLPEGNYPYVVGGGGVSVNKRENPESNCTNGGSSQFGENIAYGGKAGYVEQGEYHGGKGGVTPKIENTCYEMFFNSAGNDGDNIYTKLPTTLLGGESIYEVYGKGAGIVKGNVDYSAPGYLLLVKLS